MKKPICILRTKTDLSPVASEETIYSSLELESLSKTRLCIVLSVPENSKAESFCIKLNDMVDKTS